MSDWQESEESIGRIVARRTARWFVREAETREFGLLLLIQSTGAAGDAIVAIALAGSLFFAVPETSARGRIALYLALTMAPFSIVAPVLSRWLDGRTGGLKLAMFVASLGRAVLSVLLVYHYQSIYLFPIAFGLLVMSRVILVSKGALLPEVVPPGRALVAANASLSKFSAMASILAVGPGLLLTKWPGPKTEIYAAAVVYAIGAFAALGLPRGHQLPATSDQAPRTKGRVFPATIRQAVVAVAGMRLLVGFLIFHLAFAFRDEGVGSLGLGAVIGSAAFGSLLGAIAAGRTRSGLTEEGIILTSLGLGGLVGVLVGLNFSVTSAAALVFGFGMAYGASKVAFDSVVQRDAEPRIRGWAFARFESILQLCWVAGALLPVLVTISGPAGVIGVGIVSTGLGLLYALGRLAARRSTIPS